MKFKINKLKIALTSLLVMSLFSSNVLAEQIGNVNMGSSNSALKEITENKQNNIKNKIVSPNIKPNNEIKLYINREEIKIATINYNGNLYLPVRDIANIINKEVSYDATNKIVYLGHIELPVGYNFAVIRGNATSINKNDSNIGTIVVENKTYLPIRFILESFGYDVNYNPKTKIAEAYLMGVEGVEQGFIYSVDEDNIKENEKNKNEITDENFWDAIGKEEGVDINGFEGGGTGEEFGSTDKLSGNVIGQ